MGAVTGTRSRAAEVSNDWQHEQQYYITGLREVLSSAIQTEQCYGSPQF
jgi:hypothetical protein